MFSYPVLAGRQDGFFGGAEVQLSLVGRALARRGHEVSFVTVDYGQADGVDLDGIRVYKAYDPEAGIRVLRFLSPRLTGLWGAMRRADADVYIQRMGEVTTGLAAGFCQHARKVFVFSAAHENDCRRELPHCKSLHERILYRYGLRRAAIAIAQTMHQSSLLQSNFGVASTVIRSCGIDPGISPVKQAGDGSVTSPRVLWIGRFEAHKRLDMLLDAARQCPEVYFDVIGDSQDANQARELRQRMEVLPNVTAHGWLPHRCIEPFYRQAAAYILTSCAEGFPNTFIEAWSHGVPVITTYDPDGIVEQHGLGLVVQNVRQLCEAIHHLLGHCTEWNRLSKTVREHYLHNHTPELIATHYEDVLTRARGRA